MYIALRKAKIKAKYEGETFVLLNGFHFENEVYERQANGKGEYKNRGCKRILPIKYTPDFIGEDFIIETKGRANESFPMRWKLFTHSCLPLSKPWKQAKPTPLLVLTAHSRWCWENR